MIKRAIALLALSAGGIMFAPADGMMFAPGGTAQAAVYCEYVDYPPNCLVRPNVVLRARPVARRAVTPGVGAPGVGVRPGTPANRGGPVNRAGRR